MNADFTIQDRPRTTGDDTLAGLPLTTIGWRALQESCSEARLQREALKKGLLALASETAALSAAAARREEDGASRCLEHAQRLRAILTGLGVDIVAPEGRPYAGRLLEYLENIAQVTRAGISGPVVEEVVRPAILYRGEILRMGKAVIALPLDMAALTGLPKQGAR